MTGRQGRTWSGQPALSEEEELKRKSHRKSGLGLGEIFGSKDDGSSNHPVAKETGHRGASNSEEDSLSGDEGLEPTPRAPD